MGFAKALFDFFGGAAKVVTWFMTALVIPLVTWAVVLRTDVRVLQDKYHSVSSQITDVRMEAKDERDKITEQLNEQTKLLYDISGQIKRMK